MNKSSSFKNFMKRKEFSLILMLVLVIAFFAILSKGIFFKALNIRNILNAMVIVSFLTVGEAMLIIYGSVTFQPVQ